MCVIYVVYGGASESASSQLVRSAGTDVKGGRAHEHDERKEETSFDEQQTSSFLQPRRLENKQPDSAHLIELALLGSLRTGASEQPSSS